MNRDHIKPILSSVFILAAVFVFVAKAQEPPRGKGNKNGQGSKGAGAGGQVEPAVVPDYPINSWLCRPGANSITVSVMAWQELDAVLNYGNRADDLSRRSDPIHLSEGGSKEVVLDGLLPDTEGFYRLSYRLVGEPEAMAQPVRSFHTKRAPGSAYSFTVQADSHLDLSTNVQVYEQTLRNMLADRPDFMLDLGDTTMVDKFGELFMLSASQYRAQRYYLGQIAHTVPVLMVLGNHDGERGDRLAMANWSMDMRHRHFPNPTDGNDKSSYYAFEWGSALFVTLDPFWPSTQRKGDDNWSMTLGEPEYQWLTKILETSEAPFKFVFIHHLVGGLGKDVRGGARTAAYMEWGGKNADGTEGFAENRQGWEMPIHALLVKHGVSIVFHGHDHLYAKEELDGIIYQEVPQPGHPTGGTRSAEEYGYTGTILGSSGHLRVTVGPQEASIDYVQSTVPGITSDTAMNGTVAHRYVIQPAVRQP